MKSLTPVWPEHAMGCCIHPAYRVTIVSHGPRHQSRRRFPDRRSRESGQPMERLHRTRVLVTGGAGFLGSHLCARLLRDGAEVVCVDNFSTGSRDNVLPLLDQRRFELIRHDVCLPLHVEVDEIYNLACPASPAHYQSDPVQTLKICVFGAHHALGLARRVKAKALQASTSEVYGDPDVHPQRESYWGNVNPNGARSCYDE